LFLGFCVFFFFFFFSEFNCFYSLAAVHSVDNNKSLNTGLDFKLLVQLEIELGALDNQVFTTNNGDIVFIILIVHGDISAAAFLLTLAVGIGFTSFEFTESAHHFVGELGLDLEFTSAYAAAVFAPVPEVSLLAGQPELDTSRVTLELAPHDMELEGNTVELVMDLGPELMPLGRELHMNGVEEAVDVVEEVLDAMAEALEGYTDICKEEVEPQAEAVSALPDADIDGGVLEVGYLVVTVSMIATDGTVALSLVELGVELDLDVYLLLDNYTRGGGRAGEDERRCGSGESDKFKELHVFCVCRLS